MPKSTTKPVKRNIRAAKKANASEAIGKIEKNTDTFILTYGQFSLIDALCVILDQTGPADVSISTWTAADAHLERSADLLESAQIRSFRMIIDRSFETRQPKYCHHMRRLFGPECIRAIRTHAKFMLIRSDTHNVVVRTSMNLNENPRLENIEISEDTGFAEFFQTIVDDVFSEVDEKENKSPLPELENIQETFDFKEIEANVIKRENLNEPETTHTV
jgi:hypothetical protein